MVYLAVRKVPPKLTLNQVVQQLVKVIKGDFEAINFGPIKAGVKICYIRLSDRLDPRRVVDTVNRLTRFNASITQHLPTLPTAKKKGKIPLKARMALRIPTELGPDSGVDRIFVQTHNEILVEMQMKYTGLYNLSKKTGDKLIEGVARTLFERLKQVSDSYPESLESGFKLSGAYRRMHPHFGDFQLILSTLHRLQDGVGAPRTQLVESDLISVPIQPYVVDNVPFDKVQAACAKYSGRIAKKIAEHVRKLNVENDPGDNTEEIARKKVRTELKKLTPYLPLIIKEVISNHFVPPKGPFHKVRMYGEPFMPKKEAMMPLLKRYRAVSVMRSDRIYNMLRFNVPLNRYTSLMAMDGTVEGGAKLVIRSSDTPTMKAPRPLVREMRAAFGVSYDDPDLADEEVLPEVEDEVGDEEAEEEDMEM